MPETRLPIYQVGALAGTRAMLGAGVALLVADRLSPRTRRIVGVILLAVGLVTTAPLVRSVVHGVGSAGPTEQTGT
ncbi:MAG: hypothetical protein R2737_09195 [Candidatus Nanopelagicales bacterium]